MNFILAIFLPFLSVMFAGKFFTGLVLMALQLTLVGWVPATIIAWLIIIDSRKVKQ